MVLTITMTSDAEISKFSKLLGAFNSPSEDGISTDVVAPPELKKTARQKKADLVVKPLIEKDAPPEVALLPDTTAITVEQMRSLATAKIDASGEGKKQMQMAIKQIISALDANAVSSIPVEKRVDFMNAIKNL